VKSEIVALVLVALMAGLAWATETENLGIRVLPASGKVVVDGQVNDWDLSGGVFCCGDVENAREKMAVWFHMMYDQDNLYVLARWYDPTPLNNPGVTSGDFGFQGDCLQFRFITAPGKPDEKCTHVTAWQGRDDKDLIDLAFGKDFDQGKVRDAKAQGAQQAFTINADKKGYVQEIALPWKLLTRSGAAPKTGDTVTVTLEPNFTIGASGRLTIKDIFKPGVTPDRVFTFMAAQVWGPGTIEAKGPVEPKPVRLSDGREFTVRMVKGLPDVDWTGIVKSRELQGFKPIAITLAEDGYVSVVIKDSGGVVARELLTATFMTKGTHEVKWDALGTPNWRIPGDPVPPGAYTWSAIYHKGIGLRLKGWACNSGLTPWDYPAGKGNWGGDHGNPAACAADDEKVYLGWSAAEAGKALLACDLDGHVQWNNTHGGIAGAWLVAVDGDTVYALNDTTLYRVEKKGGTYTPWAGSDSTDLKVEKPNAMAAGGGKLYLAYTGKNSVAVLDGSSGKPVRQISVSAPGGLAVSQGRLFVISGGHSVVAVDLQSGQSKPVASGLQNAACLAVDKSGKIYVGGPDNQVKVFGTDGKEVAAIGRKGGRATIGQWTPDGMAFISGITVDAQGKLWVMEADDHPKRVSVWDSKTGGFVKEFFGPTAYGALGGAINPADPNLMVGQGCEWRLDPKTGQASCVTVFTREGMGISRFFIASNKKVYLAVSLIWLAAPSPTRIYEWLGEGQWKNRAYLWQEGKTTKYWADENGDQQVQPNEVTSTDGVISFGNWYMNCSPEGTLGSGNQLFKIAGFTSCGAPKYDLGKPVRVPEPAFVSGDSRLALTTGAYMANNSWMTCYDVASGKALWRYPDTFVGVHGSHNAPPPEVGLVRGSYGPCGSGKLPDPIGNFWVIATNIGEWHMITEGGFYLTRLFQGDAMKIEYPEQAIPGASLDNCPPGMGGEDFGGSITLAKDGKLYLQAGKTAFWNIEVVGLETVKALKGGTIQVTAEDVQKAPSFKGQYQTGGTTAVQALTARKMTPTFTGDLDADFKGCQVIQYQKTEEAAARSAAAYDAQNLYLAWDVKDGTPWVNGASEIEMIYLHGDTVDFQLATDPSAPAGRNDAVAGDLRLSIGNFKGKPTAVLYRKVSGEKHPKAFSSGVVQNYVMDSVTVVEGAKIEVKKSAKGYVVEAAIPLAVLGLKPADGLKLKGDFGVTHGDPSGTRTRLRSYWSNQHTGIVDDAVFELMMEPKNWGTIQF